MLGTLTAAGPDFYTFQGSAGDLMNFMVKSAGLTPAPAGSQPRSRTPSTPSSTSMAPLGHSFVAWNDDQFEPSDSSIIDFTLPATGTYTVEVDSFNEATHGDYELFMYRTLNYNTTQGHDVVLNTPSATVAPTINITYGTPLANTQLSGTSSVAGTFTFTPAETGTVLNAGVYTEAVTFTPNDTANYGAVSTTVQVNVAQATPTVTAFDESAVYDGAALAYPQGSGAVSVTGVSNGSDQIPTGSFTYCYADAALGYGPTSAAPTHAGAYTVLVTFTSSDANYTAAVGTATFTIDPATLTITAVNQTKAYGAALPTLTATYSGFVNGDSSASLTTQPTLTTTATSSSHVIGGPYTITANGAVDADYTIGYATGSLTVTPVALTITAANQTKAYGKAALLRR